MTQTKYTFLGKTYRELPNDKRGKMMATKAIHMLGDISSDTPDLCSIYGETRTCWIGCWVTGYGFMNVKFPKKTTRKLTKEEAEYWRSRATRIGSQPAFPVRIADKDII